MLRKKFGKKPKIKPSLKSASTLQTSDVSVQSQEQNTDVQDNIKQSDTNNTNQTEIERNDHDTLDSALIVSDNQGNNNQVSSKQISSTNTSSFSSSPLSNNNSPEKVIGLKNQDTLPDTTFAVPISPPRRLPFSSSCNNNNNSNNNSNEILSNIDHNVPIPSRELQADQSYLQAYNCRPPRTIIGGTQKITPDQLENIKNGANPLIKIKKSGRKRKIGSASNFDDNDGAESIRSTATSTTSKASKHRMRSAEVKDKMSSMEKDSEGNVIIDKEKFQLADLIYINRHYGRRKTGLQERRERKEKKEKEVKLAIELRAKEEEQSQAEKQDQNKNDKNEDDLMMTNNKFETGNDGTVIKGESNEQMVTRSRNTSHSSDLIGNSKSSTPTTNQDQTTPPILIETRELTKEELTKKNQNALSHLNIRQGEDGEMIVDVNSQIIQEQSKQEPIYDPSKITTIQNHNSQESDLSDTYRRCFVKKKPSTSAPPTKSRRWSNRENELFWDALSIVGQDFSMMEYWFKQKKVKRNKSELKSKFQREDKIFSERINLCLRTAAKRSLKESDFLADHEGQDQIGCNASQTVMAT